MLGELINIYKFSLNYQGHSLQGVPCGRVLQEVAVPLQDFLTREVGRPLRVSSSHLRQTCSVHVADSHIISCLIRERVPTAALMREREREKLRGAPNAQQASGDAGQVLLLRDRVLDDR